MHIAVGIDTVAIARFRHWRTFSYRQLARIFSHEEITYCLSNLSKSAERFAVRFAAREAFVKALGNTFPHTTFPLLTVSRYTHVIKMPNNAVRLQVQWAALGITRSYATTLSLTHTATDATAIVIISVSVPIITHHTDHASKINV